MKIVAISPFSIARTLDIRQGDELLSINGRKINDTIDYQFYSADEELTLKVKRGQQILTFNVCKGLDEELGIEIEPMQIRKCANNCVFCFADQNPPGVRDALNFRDGDFRFSFLHGHYITMTNMGQRQLERVVEQHLSPLYVSIHVTNPEIRKNMLLFNRDDRLLEKLEYLTSNGITLHTQIVLCPGWNDGDILLQTLDDLFRFAPRLGSVSVVPVGLTKYRNNLPELQSVTPEYARHFIPWIESKQVNYSSSDMERFVYLSDEWFILADEQIPPNDYYGDFSMVENGVGQCRDFVNRFQVSIPLLPKRLKRPTRLVFPTGKLGYRFLKKTMAETLDGIENLDWELIPIRNHWLGADLVTVTGLLSARDVVVQLKEHVLGDAVYLSYRMFNENGITLDDQDLASIEAKLGIPSHLHNEDMAEVLNSWA